MEVAGCVPEWNCGAWGECEYIYGVGSVLAQDVFLRGKQSQSCEDLSECIGGYNQTQDCTSVKKVDISQVEKCSNDYIEIRDGTTREIVSRLELEEGRLNIDFVLDDVAYCDFCYNDKTDAELGEDGYNCDSEGEICPRCEAGMSALRFDYFLIIILVLFVVLLIVLYYLLLKRKQAEQNKRKLRRKKVKAKAKKKSRKR